jgi:uncharacterized protein YndB with AHSA1/START domain
MSTVATVRAIHAAIAVDAPTDRAFRVFTASFDNWWPREYHIARAEMAEAILEPHVGGRWYERGVDGGECNWGHVLAWEPPHRLVVTWQINGDWRYDPDPGHASEVEVLFNTIGPEQTTVELEHRLIHRVVGGQAIHDSIRGGGGWIRILERFAKAAATEE